MALRPIVRRERAAQVLLPDRSRFLNPFDRSDLLGFYHEVAKWHGFVRFLGLPQLKDNPDMPLSSLYVEPLLTPQPVTLHQGSSGAEFKLAEAPLTALAEHPRLVVLGDPGSGKSTLVSWVALELTRTLGGPFQERLGPLVPLPMILRDLDLGPAPTWNGMLEAFLRHAVARDLSLSALKDLFERGQAFPLLDGLDEIGSVATREALRDALLEGVRRYPACRFLLTSRVVGYEQVPFHLLEQPTVHAMKAETGESIEPVVDEGLWIEVRYVAPFSDQQIERFARNWYTQREASETLREQGVRDLVGAIRASETTLGLARNPILLTLMALIHRVERTLPHGRVLLFEKIAAAYLESIDTFRGLQQGSDFSLAKKKRWLAAVAFEMQLKRLGGEAKDNQGQEGEILATERAVITWLERAMQETLVSDPELPRKFLDYIGRRSGLLLPRGEGVYSFVHLSFQEYFAAWHIAESTTTRAWLQGQAAPGLSRDELATYANDPSFREVFVLLFELLAERGDWGEVMAEVVFGEDFAKVGDGGKDHQARALLLAAVSVDPYSGWTKEFVGAAWRTCWKWELRQQQVRWPEAPWLVSFLFRGFDPASGWPALLEASKALTVHRLDLRGTGVSTLAPLAELGSLESLYLDSKELIDIRSLAEQASLQFLHLAGTGVIDVTPLAGLYSLRTLNLTNTSVMDVTSLAGLSSLKTLYLDATGVKDVTPLAGLSLLGELNLANTSIADVTPLAGLSSLLTLDLARTSVTDVTPLAGLTSLRNLYLNNTGITNVAPLAGLTSLQRLHLMGTGVTDVTPLVGLSQLDIVQ